MLPLDKPEESETTIAQVRELMQEYAQVTGLAPEGAQPQRYLWTDAFAVCTCLELFRRTGDVSFRDRALRLISQVHHTLGRHRGDDMRTGWISGLGEQEGELHPTKGGLRIGKPMNERGPDEPYDERREWDRDGQYYHYLTKWMHALTITARLTGDPIYLRWAMELARAVHPRFTSLTPSGGRKRMYWKMRIDLSSPLVPSMGQHDPLDGFVTYNELQVTAEQDFRTIPLPDLNPQIADIASICRGMNLVTNDPLGIGGLLFDISRITRLVTRGHPRYIRLLETVIDAALPGLKSFAASGFLQYPAEYRLAFRELGLSIGLAGVGTIGDRIRESPDLPTRNTSLHRRVHALMDYVPMRETIEQFWLDDRNRQAGTWTEHRGINLVMLATSLAPGGFLEI
jgi:hypothetical protein